MFEKFSFSFTLISPFMTGSNEAGGFGIDANMPLNHEKHPIIPGSLLRGVLKDVLRVVRPEEVDNLFGVKSGDGNIDPERGQIIFTDFLASTPIVAQQPLTRIKLDDKTGSVEKGAMQVIALPYAVGETVEFKGEIYLRDATQKELIEKAFALVPSIGAFKSAGFGRVKVWGELKPEPKQDNLNLKAGRHRLSLKINLPFLVNAERTAENVFQSAVTISGGAIKGAIARALSPARTHDALNNITISEARYDGCSPLSFSIVKDGETLKDMLKEEANAPIFHIDWKSRDKKTLYEKLSKTLYHAQKALARESRTRTAIENDVAKENQVFVYEYIVPMGKIWKCDILVEEDIEMPSTIFIGKSDTPVTLCAKLYTKDAQIKKGKFIKLETDAILFDEITGDDVEAAYKAYFKTNYDAKLVKFFARQKMIGGWAAKNARKDMYKPFIATLAGSVFEFEAEVDFSAALEKGLIACENSPLTPDNGYGEISLYIPMETINVASSS